MPFDNFIKFAVSIKNTNGKKHISKFPDNWTKISKSIYNNEDNFAILTGKINNIIVIDIDLKDTDFNSLHWFESNFGKLENLNTLVTKTIGGGYHIFFKYNDQLKESKLKFNKLDIDILSNKRCVFQGVGYDILFNNIIRDLTELELTLLVDQKKSEKQQKPTLKYEEIREIILSLNWSRADIYDDWIRVGFFLSSITNGDLIFKEFSKKSPKYDESSHNKHWDNLCQSTCDNPITIGTIFKWLKEDNITVFNKYQENNKIISELDTTTKKYGYHIEHKEIVKKTNKEIHASHKNELMFISEEHKNNFKRCTHMNLYSIVKNNGLVFKCKNCSFSYPNHPMNLDQDIAPLIYNLIITLKNEDINNKDTSQVARKIIEYSNNSLIYDENNWYVYNNSNGLYDKKIDLEIINEIEHLVENNKNNDFDEEWCIWINNISYREKILKELKVKCYNKKIIFDNKPNILGFENGVFDLDTYSFKIGNQSDYTTMKCYMHYDENFDYSLAKSILIDIFQDEYQYALDIFTLCLYGKNNKQKMTMNYGFSASNGKSFLMERLKNAFGDYGDTFNVNLLTAKNKNAGDANSTLINFKNKRLLYCSEPESKQLLNINLVKSLTGDTIKARGLYDKNEILIEPTFHIFMCCNILPSPDGEDNGFNRRINILEFKSKFVDIPKNKYEKKLIQFSKDDMYNIEIGLIHLMIHNYKTLKENNFIIHVPKHIQNMVNLYTNENTNALTSLLSDNYTPGTDKDFVTIKDIKDLLSSNNIKKDTVTIINIIKITFPEAVFYERKSLNNKDFRNLFLHLKNI